MKKIFLSCAAVALVALGLSSCASNKTVSYTRTEEPAVKGMIADVNVQSTKVEGVFKWDGKKKEIVDEGQLMANAVYNALQTVGADVLVAPQYNVTTEIRANSKFVTVKVAGYPGTYANFRPAPVASKFKADELKNDANYMITAMDNEGRALSYQIVVPFNKDTRTINLDDACLEKIVLDANGQCAKKCAGKKVDTPKAVVPAEEPMISKSIFKKLKK